jgi:histidinol phosphatase-like PHP family hydrolase
MKKVKSDWHIHTEYSCDSACITMEDLVNEQKQNGITDFGVTDHLHSLRQENDILRSRKAYDEIIEKYPYLKGHFHFGIEASVMSKWDLDNIKAGINIHRRECPKEGAIPQFAFNDEFLNKYGIEYVVAGVHWQLYRNTTKQGVIDEYFRQYMYAATHPQVDVLAHFLWWNHWEKDVDTNPFEDMDVITQSMRSEFECALKENNVAFDINASLICTEYGEVTESFTDEYLSYCKELQDKGISLAMATDLHDRHITGKYDHPNELFDKYKIDVDKFWKLK